MARSVEEVAALPDPVGEVIARWRRPNGLEMSQVRVPLGVIAIIYESRPNVTVDAAALCVKSRQRGDAARRQGGDRTRTRFQPVLAGRALEAAGLARDAVSFVGNPDREIDRQILKRMPEAIDLVIPRGGEGADPRVAGRSTMPVLKHYTGNCHVYVDRAADLDDGRGIVLNAKVQRPGVCNAAETLLVHREAAPTLPAAARRALRTPASSCAAATRAARSSRREAGQPTPTGTPSSST